VKPRGIGQLGERKRSVIKCLWASD